MRLVSATETGAQFSAMSRAISRARGSTRSVGTASFTSPSCAASAPVTIRPESSRSAARAMPTSRGRIQVLESSVTTPRRTNRKPSFASFAAIRMSYCSGRVMPTPTAAPLIAAMIGLRTSQGSILATRGRSCPFARRERVAAALQIRARAERAAGAGHDHRAHRVVAVAAHQVLVQLDAHLRGVGVHALGPIERDLRDAVLDVDPCMALVAHREPPHQPASAAARSRCAAGVPRKARSNIARLK